MARTDWRDDANEELNAEALNAMGAEINAATPKQSGGRIYVRTTGSDSANSGMSVSVPKLTIAGAVSKLASYGPHLRGTWVIDIGPGTFAGSVVLPTNLTSENPIEFVGAGTIAHPTVPSTTIGLATGAALVGIRLQGDQQAVFTNLRFFGFNGTTASAGIQGSFGTKIFTQNCHFDTCFFGVTSQHGSVDVKGGIFTNCGRLANGTGNGAGVRSLMLNRHAIGTQNAGSLNLGPIFRSCRAGVFAQESSTGHVDWCSFEDNEDGVLLRVSSRANIDGSSFLRNGRGVRADSNSHAFIPTSVVFGTGADANIVPTSFTSGSEMTSDRMISGVEAAYSTSERQVALLTPDQTITSTSSTTFATWTLRAPFWRVPISSIVPPKRLTFKVVGELIGTADVKRVTARLAGTGAPAQAIFTASEVGNFIMEGEVIFLEDEQLLTARATRHLGTTTRHAFIRYANPMSSDQTFSLEAQITTAGDSIRVDVVELGWAG